MRMPGGKLVRRLLIVAAVVLVVLAVGFVFFLGQAVRTGLNTALPLLTGTPASVGKCRIYPLLGKLDLRDFTVGNPEGYQTPYALRLKEVRVRLDVASLFSDRIRVREVLVDGLAVSYETALTETNLGRIKENVDRPGSREGEEKPPDAAAEAKPGKKLQIDDLRFRNGEVTLSATVLGQNAGGTMPLPEVHLTGIGAKGGGATAGEATEQVFGALYEAIMKAVADSGSLGGQAAEDAGEAATGAVEGAVEGVRKLWK